MKSLFINFIYEEFLTYIEDFLNTNSSTEDLSIKILEYRNSYQHSLDLLPPIEILFELML